MIKSQGFNLCNQTSYPRNKEISILLAINLQAMAHLTLLLQKDSTQAMELQFVEEEDSKDLVTRLEKAFMGFLDILHLTIAPFCVQLKEVFVPRLPLVLENASLCAMILL